MCAHEKSGLKIRAQYWVDENNQKTLEILLDQNTCN
jgi:hypothetical protein